MDKRHLSGSAIRRIRRRTLLLDIISILMAFASAILIRYNAIINWIDYSANIYVTIIVTTLLFELIVFSFLEVRNVPIVFMDPAENLISLLKVRFILLLLTIGYLFVAQKSVLASRVVLGIFAVLSFIYGYVLRMIYRWLYLKRHGAPEADRSLVIDDPGFDAEKTALEFKKGGYENAVLSGKCLELSRAEIMEKADKLSDLGIRTYISVESYGYILRPGIASAVGDFAAISTGVRKDRFDLFGVHFCIARLEEAVHHVLMHVDALKGEYVCFSNVHTAVMAKENPEYRKVLNSAALTFPDGLPIAKLEKYKGYFSAERVAGPDFMANMFRDSQDGSVSHYFYGASEETLEKLKENLLSNYPGLDIRGMYSPPFRELTAKEDEEDIKRINESGADIVWIGLGAPKQEKWMMAHKGRINAVMMGVGAGFDFHAGTIDRAPQYIQKIGLEWLYRLFKDPKRLFKRYFVTNIKFFWYMMTEIVRRKHQ